MVCWELGSIMGSISVDEVDVIKVNMQGQLDDVGLPVLQPCCPFYRISLSTPQSSTGRVLCCGQVVSRISRQHMVAENTVGQA